MAKAFVGEAIIDPERPDDEIQRRADEALTRVERFLGVDVEQAKEILSRVLQDVS
jgi:hypothetical protein